MMRAQFQAQAQAQAQDAQVEVDFLGLEMDKKASEAAAPPPHQPQSRLDRRRSFRDICKMDPEIVKSVIASAGKTIRTTTLPSDAQEMIKLAMELESSAYNNDGDLHHSSLNAQPQNILPELDEGDMPIKRSQSLQRFFEKRKERLIPVFPYSYSVHRVAQPHSGEKASSQA
ncbi:hypothetical protein Cgig2_027026 [Carnegiea gigantea]|uniref:Uncharacterized protein n=1 Tax=Carnegiea gigantea TaxID=171969 RepID=A0A9Q1K916_9CARY|nr:hypothetical protein Cgig2_027026 [Carnegiea gigantea]